MITKPTLVLNPLKCRNNIRKMADKAEKCGVIFRPHFKTHQSAGVGDWFRQMGIEKITVSSAGMASYFADAGWKDILVAFPLNHLEIDTIRTLNSRVSLHLLVDNTESVELLGRFKDSFSLYIKIDTGNGRAGIPGTDEETVNKLANAIESAGNLTLTGFLSHDGHTYQAKSRDEISAIFMDSTRQLQSLKRRYPDTLISVGDTPSCSIVEDLSGADEIRPGNFIFYDLMMAGLGACSEDDIAVALVCPVVSVYPHRNEALIYGGAIHLSKDYLEVDGTKIFGKAAPVDRRKWQSSLDDTYVTRVSQEHGIISAPAEIIRQLKPGMNIAILPVHSCLTANLMGSYMLSGGEKMEMYRYSSFG